MKRVLSTLLSASLAAGSITASMPEVFADDYVCDFTEEQIEASEVKPEIFLTIDGEKYGKVFDAEEMAGKTVTCSINVSGAEDKYCTTQFHIYYDQRLKIIDKDERELCTKGSAIDNLYKLINQRDFTHDILVNETDDMVKMNSFIVGTAGAGNKGKDGVMWTFDVQIPEDAESGSCYALDISYCNDNLSPDYFTNSKNDDSGKLMQAYAFTNGIFNGKTRLFEPDSDDVDLCPALEKISSQADGYIAMEGEISDEPKLVQTGAIGENAQYSLYSNGDVVISGEGDTFDCDEYTFSEVNPLYRVDINKLIVEEGITSIGSYLFGASKVNSVELPESLTRIGTYAFSYCDELENINIAGTDLIIEDAAFTCSNLKSVIIPDSVRKIGRVAFNSCLDLESVTIAESITDIGEAAFSGTKWMEDRKTESPFVIVNGILLDGTACSGDIVIPDTVTKICSSAFYHNHAITSVTIPDSVTVINSDTFYRCDNLESIVIPSSVKEIPERMLCECSSLNSIVIPDSVTLIGPWAFTRSGLNTVKLPDSVTAINEGAFYGCIGLEEIIIPESVTVVDQRVFGDCTSLKTVTVLNPDCQLYRIAQGPTESAFNEDFTGTIRSFAGSAVQSFAEENGYNFEAIKENVTTTTTTTTTTSTTTTTTSKATTTTTSKATTTTTSKATTTTTSKATTTTTSKTTTTTTSSEATTTTTLPDKYKSTLSYENDEDSPFYYIPEESSGYNIKAEVEVEGPKKLDETDSADGSIINAIRSYLTSSFEKALKAIGDPEQFAEKTEQIAEEAVKSFNEISDTGYTATKIEITDISKSDKGNLKYTLGDLNDDGAVDGTDATIVLREFGNILAGKGESFTPEQVAAGDVDRNGVIDGSDATIILKFYGEAGNDIEISYAGMVPWMEKNYWNR